MCQNLLISIPVTSAEYENSLIYKDTCHSVVRSLITSQLDYCYSLYNGTTGKNLDRLQRSYKTKLPVSLTVNLHVHTKLRPFLKELHWLPVRERIHHKALTLV